MNIAAKQCCKKDCPTWENMTQSAARGNKPSFPIFQLDLGGFRPAREAAATRKPKEARDPRERRFLPKTRGFATEPQGFPVSGPPGKPDFPWPRPPASPSASLGWNGRRGSPRPLFGGAREPSPGRQRRAPRLHSRDSRTHVCPAERAAGPLAAGGKRGAGGPRCPSGVGGSRAALTCPRPRPAARGQQTTPEASAGSQPGSPRGQPGASPEAGAGAGPPAPSGSTHRAVVAAGPAPTFYSGPPPPWRHFPCQCPCQAPCSAAFPGDNLRTAHRGRRAGTRRWTDHPPLSPPSPSPSPRFPTLPPSSRCLRGVAFCF